jgi:hypothetical protein
MTEEWYNLWWQLLTGFPGSYTPQDMLAEAVLVGVIGITSLGAVSRWTHGRYTPALYRYQVDRAPDDETTELIPYADAALATLLVLRPTRTAAAAVCVLMQGLGIAMRVQAGKQAVTDVALASAAAFVAWSSAMGVY